METLNDGPRRETEPVALNDRDDSGRGFCNAWYRRDNSSRVFSPKHRRVPAVNVLSALRSTRNSRLARQSLYGWRFYKSAITSVSIASLVITLVSVIVTYVPGAVNDSVIMGLLQR